MTGEMEYVIAKGILYGVTVVLVILTIIAAYSPDLIPNVQYGVLGAAVLSVVLLQPLYTLLMVLYFLVMFLWGLRASNEKYIQANTKYVPGWLRNTPNPQLAMKGMEVATGGFHRPERVADRTGEIPTLTKS